MGWLGDLWKKIEGRETVDMMFVDNLDQAQGAALEADKCYVELYVDSLRLRNVRKFATKFHGVVYSFVTLPYQADAKIKVPAISKPENLAQLDPDGLAKVITINKQMMGAIPWRGGPLSLELGLFSVKGGNLLTPVLDFVTSISTVAGVSFAGQIAPFAPLITSGMDILSGQTEDVALEVGIDTALTFDRAGTFAIIAAPKNSAIRPDKLTLDSDRKLLHEGAPLKEAYCVFTLKRVEIKADYGEIPELKAAFGKLRDAVRGGEIDRATEALASFRLTVMTSPDLIRPHAAKLAALGEEMLADAFGTGVVPVSLTESAKALPRELADLQLYAD